MNDLIRRDDQPLMVSEARAIADAATEDAGFEKMLKFKKGTYECDGEIVPLGSEFVAHCVGWTKAWVKFEEQQVVDKKMYRVADRKRIPDREELGDMDQSRWGPGISGPHSDPWAFQYLLPLEDQSGNLVVFVTASIGGRRAVADLCKTYSRRVERTGQSNQPIIKIGSKDMPTTNYGKVPRPIFEVTGWSGGNSEGAVRDIQPTSYPPDTMKQEMDDEIPF